MARTFRYSDILSIVSKQFPRIVEDQYASICSNMATNLIWYAYDWRESLLTLPPFWLIPGEQDYKPPATVIPADFGGLRKTFVSHISGGTTVTTPIKPQQDLQVTHVVGIPQSISYEASIGGFRLFPRTPRSLGSPYWMIQGTYKCKPAVINNSTLETLIPFDDMYLNQMVDVMRWAFMSAAGDQRAGQVTVSNGVPQFSGQFGVAVNAIDMMASHEGLLQNDPMISPDSPLAYTGYQTGAISLWRW